MDMPALISPSEKSWAFHVCLATQDAKLIFLSIVAQALIVQLQSCRGRALLFLCASTSSYAIQVELTMSPSWLCYDKTL
jgi:hypothetical protein